jgi:chromosome segregation ATPase
MANDNNDINELVADDDDPTVELKAPTFADENASSLEVDAKTFDSQKEIDEDAASGVTVSELKADLRSREKTISQLQFDIEQLQAKWLGLETEIGAREEQTTQLNTDLSSLRDGVSRKEKLIKKRDVRIKSLKSEIRDRDEVFRQLQLRYDDLVASQHETDSAEDHDGPVADSPSPELTSQELQRRLDRSDDYADSMRQQTQDLIESNSDHAREIENLTRALSDVRRENAVLNEELELTVATLEENQASLDGIQSRHHEEIRNVRFELGQAQDTIVETADINTRLASDLVDAHGFKDELETMLGDVEEQSSGRIENLEREVGKLKGKSEILEHKLATKSEAISILLAEIAKKADRNETFDTIEDITQESGEYPVDRSFADTDSERHSPLERVTRVLIGSVDGQVLQFPLFKDRLTIGRTKDNDIQLKAAYVSRRHAVIQTVAEITRIIDWGSRNGIQVNSAKVSEHDLRHGDVVIIGNAKFRYEERKKRDA